MSTSLCLFDSYVLQNREEIRDAGGASEGGDTEAAAAPPPRVSLIPPEAGDKQ